jgi:hypothetical protein
VWTRQGGVWTQLGSKLVGTGGIFGQSQGQAVAISGDGRTILVGGTGDNGNSGAVWAWTRNGNVWTQQGEKLVFPDTPGLLAPEFGSALALSADGNTALIGARRGAENQGGAWAWVRSGGVWSVQARLTSSIGAFGEGFALSLTADGNMAMVTSADGVDVWTRSSSTWTHQARLGSRSAFEFSIPSVSLSADGRRAIIGGGTATARLRAHGYTFAAARRGARAAYAWSARGPSACRQADPP